MGLLVISGIGLVSTDAIILRITERGAPAVILGDFNDPSGINNPSGLRTKLVSIDRGGSTKESSWFSPSGRDGDRLIHSRLGRTGMGVVIRAEGADRDYNTLREGLEELAGLLDDGTNRQLHWEIDGADPRYIDYQTAEVPRLLVGQTSDESERALRRGLVLAQPFLIHTDPTDRGDDATLVSGTIALDPASGTGQGLSWTQPGNVRAPMRFTLSPANAGAKVVEVIMATRSRDDVADLVGETGWARCATDERGWDSTLGADTSSVNDAANGGSGNSAKVDGTAGGNTAASMLRRVRLTRTTKLDSLRGWERVFLRCRVSAPSEWEFLMKSGPSLADPAPEVSKLDTVTLDASAAASHGYVEKDLGDMMIPEEGNLGGVAIEVWARRVSGTGDLYLNLTRHLPNTPGKDELTRIVVPAGSEESWLGKDLVTPTNPAGLTAGSVVGDDLILTDDPTDAGGAPPGLAWPTGHHRVTFDVFRVSASSSLDYSVRVRNVTDSTTPANLSVTNVPGTDPQAVQHTLEFDTVAGKVYQPQVVIDGGGIELRARAIAHKFIPVVGQNEQITTDPERSGEGLEKRGSSGELLVQLESEGEVPFVVRPGTLAVFVVPLDVPRSGYAEPESVKARTATLVAAGASQFT